ncbi:hypothetical protein MLD38_035061 [Melastoma candidum]|uniref:Uncharacterized protein n=1 Tax=Melastoma candidum TaxID=119954 RepID=A0ACB9MBX0_9MYRT|nr:hypothetical protein MLD38_035061 [Melastoma candidum]
MTTTTTTSSLLHLWSSASDFLLLRPSFLHGFSGFGGAWSEEDLVPVLDFAGQVPRLGLAVRLPQRARGSKSEGAVPPQGVVPLIAFGNKKTLDLEDVPQLDPRDSVVTGYPYFRRNILSENSGSGGGVTTLGLAKALVMLAMFILYKDLGPAAISALIATVLVMLLNVPLGKWLEKSQDKLMESKDKRMKATSEILRNMRILKLQGWEMKFLSKIKELRNSEEGWLKKYVYTQALTSFVFWGAPTFVAVATFSSCMVMGIPLSSGKILSALATFKILQEPICNLPDVISMIAQTKVSLDRISAFLRLDDLQNDMVERIPSGTSNVAIEITDGNFSWDSSASEPTLKDLNLKVEMGMKVAVCGMVGSGKSSLLSCILGELSKITGMLRLCGTKAYVAQSPWIQSGKIEDNILFGLPMDREKYERILEACCLKKDLEILPFGDQTMIGERGINLSGGQKQRVQIARALYQDADIYLFDDPFSAVDAHTGSHLYKECLLGFLSSKTVIYVTHQVEFLPTADLILVMKGGRITEAGKYIEILREGSDFKELVDAHRLALSGLESERSNDESTSGDKDADKDKKTKAKESKGNAAAEGGKGQLVQEEEREKGKVGFPVYWKYITTAYGGALVPFILLAQVLFQLLQIASNYWMAWATPVSEGMEPAVPESTLILVYIAMASGSALCVLIRALLLATAGYKTATILFNKLHHAIFRAPMSFFDSTPSGRILNRASTDQSAVDTSIQYRIAMSTFSLIQLFGAVAVVSQVAWQVFICFVPVVAISIWYQRYYIPSARELARLGGVTKAPVIQHFSETISGSTTIRSFDQEGRFRNTNMELSDAYARPKFHSAAALEWLSFRLDVLSSLTFAMSLIFLISIPKGLIDPAIAGLAVTYGLNLNWLQTWVIWNICSMENTIISVERIQQYTAIESEPPLVIEDNRPPQSWPSCGEISLRDLQVRYAPQLPLVLQGISCTFLGGAKTGVVGRTGSGKSTMIQTLFRKSDEPSKETVVVQQQTKNHRKQFRHDRPRESDHKQDKYVDTYTLMTTKEDQGSDGKICTGKKPELAPISGIDEIWLKIVEKVQDRKVTEFLLSQVKLASLTISSANATTHLILRRLRDRKAAEMSEESIAKALQEVLGCPVTVNMSREPLDLQIMESEGHATRKEPGESSEFRRHPKRSTHPTAIYSPKQGQLNYSRRSKLLSPLPESKQDESNNSSTTSLVQCRSSAAEKATTPLSNSIPSFRHQAQQQHTNASIELGMNHQQSLADASLVTRSKNRRHHLLSLSNIPQSDVSIEPYSQDILYEKTNINNQTRARRESILKKGELNGQAEQQSTVEATIGNFQRSWSCREKFCHQKILS